MGNGIVWSLRTVDGTMGSLSPLYAPGKCLRPFHAATGKCLRPNGGTGKCLRPNRPNDGTWKAISTYDLGSRICRV